MAFCSPPSRRTALPTIATLSGLRNCETEPLDQPGSNTSNDGAVLIQSNCSSTPGRRTGFDVCGSKVGFAAFACDQQLQLGKPAWKMPS